MCKKCPIYRETASSWKKVFEAGVIGTADDLADNGDKESAPAIVLPVSPVGGGHAIAGLQRRLDEIFMSESDRRRIGIFCCSHFGSCVLGCNIRNQLLLYELRKI